MALITTTHGISTLRDFAADTPVAASMPALSVSSTMPSSGTVSENTVPVGNTVSASTALPSSIGVSWGTIIQSAISRTLFNRLVRLASAPDGWHGPGSRALRQTSISNFLEFWKLIRADAVEPELALAPDGILYAEWVRSPNQRLDAKFSDNKIFYGVITPRSVLEGADTRDVVAPILKSHALKPLQWHRS